LLTWRCWFLNSQQTHYHSLFENLPHAIAHLAAIWNDEGEPSDFIILDVNCSFAKITRFKDCNKEDLIGKKVTEILPGLNIILNYWIDLVHRIYSGNKRCCLEFYNEISGRWYELTISSTRSDCYAVLLHDITGRKHAEKIIDNYCFHDQLTGLYNRRFLEEEMQRLDSGRYLPISIIMADLNGLKLLNDNFGHSTGDQALKLTASILRESCRAEDIITRLGGDEFVVFLPKTGLKDARTICARIKEKCASTQLKNIPLSIALGIAEKNCPGKALSDVLHEAEKNMYRNKLMEKVNLKNNLTRKTNQ